MSARCGTRDSERIVAYHTFPLVRIAALSSSLRKARHFASSVGRLNERSDGAGGALHSL